jgi:cell fate (sporulation/competence/biofilm development) regulator YlbF (YheA/YmcA/DUF963 family)
MTKRANGEPDRHAETATAALDAAKALASALAQLPAFRRFEAAHERFRTDEAAQQKLAGFESKQRELRQAAMWGGSSAQEQKALEQEWETLFAIPSLGHYLRAQEELTMSLRDSVRMISDAIGIDYGAACSPSGGCC